MYICVCTFFFFFFFLSFHQHCIIKKIGATNRPQELDEAARRRFVQRCYIPLPDAVARRKLISGEHKSTW